MYDVYVHPIEEATSNMRDFIFAFFSLLPLAVMAQIDVAFEEAH